MNKHRTLQIILQANDVGDENVDTLADLKLEPGSSVRMIQSQRFIRSQRLSRPSHVHESLGRVNRLCIFAIIERYLNWHSSNVITNRNTSVIASYCHHICVVLY